MFSEMQYRNCLFVNCHAGIFLHLSTPTIIASSNANFAIATMASTEWANAYIQECHFEHSAHYDVFECANTVNVCIRRLRLKTSSLSSGQRLTVEDCVINGKTNADHAVNFVTSDKAEMIFNTRFVNPPPGALPPIKADNYRHVLLCNCR